ncbi:MAG: aminomethyltransferase family protein [Phycisphaeraceae bacterium]|nr:aminomethyltransferase family protein [Phycisphaeraceae bacterium]
MSTTQSILAMQTSAGATLMDFGPPRGEEKGPVQVVETFGPFEAEYAAIRKGVGIFQMPFRGVVELTGKDRLTFLHRLATADLRALAVGQARRAFLLDKAGRIQADFCVLNLAERTLLDLDLSETTTLPAVLDKYLFTEDVRIADRSADVVHLGLFGPMGAKLLEAVTGQTWADLAEWGVRAMAYAGSQLTVFRRDDTGSPGLHLLAARDVSAVLYEALAAAVGGLVPQVEDNTKRPIVGRGIGWLAYNTARIEAGSPLYHIDFGPDSLPGETGLVPQTVSFTKGCYLGQEIVARMQNLGHPKRVLVGLKTQDDRLPVAGSEVLAPEGDVVGGLTSSTLSPWLGQVAVAFGMIQWGRHHAGTKLSLPAEGSMTEAVVSPLRML